MPHHACADPRRPPAWEFCMISDSAPSPGRLRVLIVDDNRDCADTLVELLQALGHNVAGQLWRRLRAGNRPGFSAAIDPARSGHARQERCRSDPRASQRRRPGEGSDRGSDGLCRRATPRGSGRGGIRRLFGEAVQIGRIADGPESCGTFWLENATGQFSCALKARHARRRNTSGTRILGNLSRPRGFGTRYATQA